MRKIIELAVNSRRLRRAIKTKYMNLLTDFGLKSIFKVEELAVAFLNDVLNGQLNIKKVTYLDKEVNGKSKYHRTAIFDLLCQDDQNREFIIEIQRIKQEFFIDRSIFYTSARIQENAPKGKQAMTEWDFEQKPIIFIGLLDFELPHSKPGKFKTIGQICDIEDKTVLFNKLTYIYLELPKFEKASLTSSLDELTNLGKWLYTFKNLHNFEQLPEFLNEGQFHKILEIAEVANMTAAQRQEYERSLKQLRNDYANRTTAFKEGEEKKQVEMVKILLLKGLLSPTEIAENFNLEESYILSIKESIAEEKR